MEGSPRFGTARCPMEGPGMTLYLRTLGILLCAAGLAGSLYCVSGCQRRPGLLQGLEGAGALPRQRSVPDRVQDGRTTAYAAAGRGLRFGSTGPGVGQSVPGRGRGCGRWPSRSTSPISPHQIEGRVQGQPRPRRRRPRPDFCRISENKGLLTLQLECRSVSSAFAGKARRS